LRYLFDLRKDNTILCNVHMRMVLVWILDSIMLANYYVTCKNEMNKLHISQLPKIKDAWDIRNWFSLWHLNAMIHWIFNNRICLILLSQSILMFHNIIEEFRNNLIWRNKHLVMCEIFIIIRYNIISFYIKQVCRTLAILTHYIEKCCWASKIA
jgi:hypothetical protein